MGPNQTSSCIDSDYLKLVHEEQGATDFLSMMPIFSNDLHGKGESSCDDPDSLGKQISAFVRRRM